jgi:hypothetical protein
MGCIASRREDICFANIGQLAAKLLTVTFATHCNENPIYVFLSWELRGLSPNFDIHVSMSDLYMPRISPHIFLQ